MSRRTSNMEVTSSMSSITMFKLFVLTVVAVLFSTTNAYPDIHETTAEPWTDSVDVDTSDDDQHYHHQHQDSAVGSGMSTSTGAAVETPVSTAPNPPDPSESAVDRAVVWLKSQRATDWGWGGNDTPAALVALQLAARTPDVTHVPEVTLETQLSAKQMEIEILMLLWRHHEVPIASGQLALYTLALNTLCHDPRQFHGHDLIGTLQHHESQRDADFALSTLAACSASAHVRKRQIRRLLDIANAAADHNVDTVAMVILALRCIVQDHRHRNLQHFVRRPSLGLARQQQPDGGFGNLHTTALAMQALHTNHESTHSHWNRTAAVSWMLDHQQPDGSFGDIRATSEAILALTWRGLSSIRTLDCGHASIDTSFENHVEVSDEIVKTPSVHLNDSEARNVTVTYSLWVDTNVTKNYTMTLIAPRNISFYHVMQMAAEQDSEHFGFSASEWPNGHYVHTLAGYKEEPTKYYYWLLYRLPSLPDPANPPANQLVAPVGVDDLLIDDGEHYLFWYKKL